MARANARTRAALCTLAGWSPLAGRHHGAFVAAGALADDVGGPAGLGLQTAQVGEQRAVARRGVGQGKIPPGEIDLQGELGHVETDVEGMRVCEFVGNRHGIGSSLFCELAMGRLTR